MNLTNLTIRLNPRKLNSQLPTIEARALHSFVVAVVNIPDDVTGVVLSVFKTDGVSRFDTPVSRRPGHPGGICHLLPTVFPEVGTSRYEVRATDSRGYETALGEGTVEIGAFSDALTPIDPGEPVAIHSIADASGALHTIRAVPDGMGGYTTIVE